MNARERTKFSRRVARWWREHRRDLPWRRTRDPYRILVAEVMLQQTQVPRVLPAYERFLRRFPTIAALSRAEQAEVVRMWSGLGYNRRAIMLHRTAKIIVRQFGGRVPLEVSTLRTLPGIGDYTARAIVAFATDARVAPVDTNIRRVLIRHFGVPDGAALRELAEELLPRRNAASWSHMLMDFGAMVCTARNPKCAALELPHRAEPKPRSRPTPFLGSHRYWRGRIVAVLRAERVGVGERMLYRKLPKGSQALSHSEFSSILRALEREGMIVRKRAGSFVRLA